MDDDLLRRHSDLFLDRDEQQRRGTKLRVRTLKSELHFPGIKQSGGYKVVVNTASVALCVFICTTSKH